jgi:hypothetical protein
MVVAQIADVQAFTTKPLPRILLMVLALAGDSTMTTGFP